MTRLLAAWPTADPLEAAVLVLAAAALAGILVHWIWHKLRRSDDWSKEGNSPWFL